jgi:peptidoglycan hydrolase-like protein with peptidoglycan-binding domain
VNTDNTNTSGIVAGATKFKFINNMSYGSRLDPDVTELHKFLIAKGLLQIKAPTGWFGPLTRAAVKKYQKAKQLPETGVVGDMTRNALNQEE